MIITNLFNDLRVTHEFILDNSKSSMKHKFVTKINLSFFTIWALFRCVPKQSYYGKLKFEWVISDNYNNTYSIFYFVDNTPLLNIKEWSIGSSTSDEICIAEFMNTLCKALQVYNKFYKQPIENKTFISDDPEINEYLQDIKKSLYENKSTLKCLK